MLTAPAPAGTVTVSAPPPTGGEPLAVPDLPPGVPVVIGAAPGATVATLVDLALRTGPREILLRGG